MIISVAAQCENDKFDKDEGFCNEEILPDTPDATKALETLEQAYSDTHELDEDERYMKEALALARQAEAIDEVPVGAVVVKDGEIIASAFNTRDSIFLYVYRNDRVDIGE